MKGKRAIWLTLLWAVLPALSAPFDATTFEAFERTRPLPEQVSGYRIDSSRPGLAVVVSQACEVRQLPDGRKEFLKNLGTAFGRPDVFDLYTRELRVEERDESRWIPFQDATIDHLLRGACGEPSKITITVRYMATHQQLGRIYVGIGYNRASIERPERMSCFATELIGVEIGAKLETVRADLKARYGAEMDVPPQGDQRRRWAYEVDAEHETTLIVGDAGHGPRDRVFSVQLWGAPNPQLELTRGMRLGQSEETINEKLGPPESMRPAADGFKLLRYKNSPCSVELRNGVLASIMIVGDPNYFGQ